MAAAVTDRFRQEGRKESCRAGQAGPENVASFVLFSFRLVLVVVFFLVCTRACLGRVLRKA
jgi:hypothetical protein